jgi:hypothetical protein
MEPPYYILFSTQPSNSSSLGHPTIQYQYADDSPLSLLPQHPDEHVLLLEYDQNSSVPTVTSTSTGLIVTGVKVEEAPGAAVAEDKHNDRMYIIEATTPVDDKLSIPGERPSPHTVIAQFKQRNLVIRQALSSEGSTLKSAASSTSSGVGSQA